MAPTADTWDCEHGIGSYPSLWLRVGHPGYEVVQMQVPPHGTNSDDLVHVDLGAISLSPLARATDPQLK
ncbi:MAG: hypothetical protein AB9869_00070 [Verrucomicrobiia bacterium]